MHGSTYTRVPYRLDEEEGKVREEEDDDERPGRRRREKSTHARLVPVTAVHTARRGPV